MADPIEKTEKIIAAPGAPGRDKPGVLVGDWNHLEASIGQRGTGKSTYQAYRAWELARIAGGAYVVGHSLGARLPDRLPPDLGGVELPITYYPTIAKLERGLRAHPGRWHILAPPLEGDGHAQRDAADPDTADDLLRFALRLSTALKKQAWEREHFFSAWNPSRRMTGIRLTPIIVVIDEGIAVEAAGTGQSSRSHDRWFLQLIASLRHNHMALLYAIQEPSSRSWRVLEAATAIHVFRIRHQWALNAVAAAGATPDQIETVRTLPAYSHVTIGGSEVEAAPAASPDATVHVTAPAGSTPATDR